jgi:O-antigen/teichoic acid export membrane protein
LHPDDEPNYPSFEENDLSMLLRQTLLYLPAQLLGPLCQFAAAVGWTHYLAPTDYGVLAYIIAAQDLTLILSIQWWSVFTARFVRRLELSGSWEDFRQTDFAIVLGGTLVQVLIAVLVLEWTGMLNPSLLCATALFFVTRGALVHYGERARATERILVYTITQMASAVVGSLLTFPVLFYVSTRPEALIWTLAVPQAIALIIVARMLHVPTRISRIDRDLIASALRYGMPLLLSWLCGWICVNGIRFVVERWADLAAVGLVSVGWGLGMRLASVVSMLGASAGFPRAILHFELGDVDAAHEHVSKSGVLLVALLAPAAAGVFMIASQFTDVFISESFRAVTYLVLPIAMLTAVIRSIRAHFLDQVSLLHERTMVTLAINVVDVVSGMVGCIAGMAFGGLYWAVLGSLLGAVPSLCLSVVSARHFGLRLPVGEILRILLAVVAMVGGMRLLPPLSGIGGLAVLILSGSVVYGLAMSALFFREIRAFAATRSSASSEKGAVTPLS